MQSRNIYIDRVDRKNKLKKIEKTEQLVASSIVYRDVKIVFALFWYLIDSGVNKGLVKKCSHAIS